MRTLLKFLILPPAGPLLLAALGALLLRRRPRLGMTLVIGGLASLWLLSVPIIADQLSRLAEAYPPLDWRSAAAAQAEVILGGGGLRSFAPEYGGPAAEPLMLERLSYGAFVAKKTGLPVLVTGAPLEAAAMRETLRRNFSVEPRWVDGESHDTFDNAENSARLLRAEGIRRIVLVTHSTHMRRSVREFSAAGFDVVPAPAGVLEGRELVPLRYFPNVQALLRSYIALYEILGEPAREVLAATGLRRHPPHVDLNR